MTRQEDDRIAKLREAGLEFSGNPSPEASRRIKAMSDDSFEEFLKIISTLSGGKSGPKLYYNGPFQTRSFED